MARQDKDKQEIQELLAATKQELEENKKLNAALQQEKADLKAAMDQAILDKDVKLQALLKKSMEDNNAALGDNSRLNSELEVTKAKTTKELADLKKEHTQTVLDKEAAHQRDLTEKEILHQQNLQALKDEHDAKITALGQGHDKEKKSLIDSHQKALDDLVQKHTAVKEQLKSLHAAELSQTKSSLDALNNQHRELSQNHELLQKKSQKLEESAQDAIYSLTTLYSAKLPDELLNAELAIQNLLFGEIYTDNDQGETLVKRYFGAHIFALDAPAENEGDDNISSGITSGYVLSTESKEDAQYPELSLVKFADSIFAKALDQGRVSFREVVYETDEAPNSNDLKDALVGLIGSSNTSAVQAIGEIFEKIGIIDSLGGEKYTWAMFSQSGTGKKVTFKDDTALNGEVVLAQSDVYQTPRED